MADPRSVEELTDAILACARLEGNAAALDLFLDLRESHGLDLLEMDLVLPKIAGQDPSAFMTMTYLRQGLAVMSNLAAGKAVQDSAGGVRVDDIRRAFADYQRTKKTR